MPNCNFCYQDAGDKSFHPACARRFFGVPEMPLLTLNDALLSELAKQTINQRIAVTGVQPKLSVSLEKAEGKSRLTIVGLWGEFILKPRHPHYPMMPETEDLTMHIASLFKIPVCAHALLQATDGSMVYLAKRFDRQQNKKVHVEDLCQLSEFLTENKYKGSYEKAGKLVMQYCRRGLDALNYFELVLFCYLTGNNDMHLKNFSLLHAADGPVLSPAYDLLNVNLVNPADNEELALTLNGRKRKIKRTDFVALAHVMGLHEKVWQKSFERFAAQNAAVFDLIDRSFLDEESKVKYKEIWTNKQKILNQ
jgi:serine/threonine-protein kinase HipA